MKKKSRALFVVVGFALMGIACNKHEEVPPPSVSPPPSPTAAAPAAAAPAAGSGTIKGVVKLNGTPPEAKLIKRDTDPYCARKQMKEEDAVVGAGDRTLPRARSNRWLSAGRASISPRSKASTCFRFVVSTSVTAPAAGPESRPAPGDR